MVESEILKKNYLQYSSSFLINRNLNRGRVRQFGQGGGPLRCSSVPWGCRCVSSIAALEYGKIRAIRMTANTRRVKARWLTSTLFIYRCIQNNLLDSPAWKILQKIQCFQHAYGPDPVKDETHPQHCIHQLMADIVAYNFNKILSVPSASLEGSKPNRLGSFVVKFN
jgi:hypothetical protein